VVEQEEGAESTRNLRVSIVAASCGPADRLRGQVEIAAVHLVEHRYSTRRTGPQVSETIQRTSLRWFGRDPLRSWVGHESACAIERWEAADCPLAQRDGDAGVRLGCREEEVQLQAVVHGGGRSRAVVDISALGGPARVGSDESEERRHDVVISQPLGRGAVIRPCLDGRISPLHCVSAVANVRPRWTRAARRRGSGRSWASSPRRRPSW